MFQQVIIFSSTRNHESFRKYVF